MDTLKLVQEALKLAQEAQKPQGLSDTVLLAIIAGIVGLATIYLNSRIEARAEKAKTAAAAAAAELALKLAAVETKIDGRLTQLLEISKKEAEERGHRMGKEQEKKEEIDRKQEAPATSPGIHDTGPVKLTITEGEIKVVPETTKKKR